MKGRAERADAHQQRAVSRHLARPAKGGSGVIVVLLLLVADVTPAAATMLVRRMSLDEVTHAAACVVHASVIDVRSGRDDAGLPATWVTLDVVECLKGSAQGRISIKQYGVSEPLPDGTVAGIGLLPRYRTGEELVLFLSGESDRGFSSPVGLGQGVYRVQAEGGRRQVRSDVPGDGGRDLDDLIGEVKRRAAVSR
jgi:hypothetical protein